jgi:predicted XRE-type DNA-binding protein
MKINKKGLKVEDFVKVSRSHGSQVSRKKVNGFGIDI